MASYKLFILFLLAFAAVIFAKPYSDIEIEEKPLLDCPPDEVYYKCSFERCITTCKHVQISPACPSVQTGCVNPACLCRNDFLRNDEGKCVPFDQCGTQPSIYDWSR